WRNPPTAVKIARLMSRLTPRPMAPRINDGFCRRAGSTRAGGGPCWFCITMENLSRWLAKAERKRPFRNSIAPSQAECNRPTQSGRAPAASIEPLHVHPERAGGRVAAGDPGLEAARPGGQRDALEGPLGRLGSEFVSERGPLDRQVCRRRSRLGR